MSTKITYKIPEKKEITLDELSPGQVFYYPDDSSKSLYMVVNINHYSGGISIANFLTGNIHCQRPGRPTQPVNINITVELPNA